ncbi:MAG: type III secretion system outer membrane ring subunit SctC [Kiritimatiellae bacterium]|nr:type III secretion system outer membrane ring subunit SctC [Kiritimatiellia bacterium]
MTIKPFRAAVLAAMLAAAGPAVAAGTASAPSIPWKMPTYTLVARDMDLRVALDTFAVAEGLSIVISQTVEGRFSGDFKDVPPDDFLDRIATTHNLIWYYDGAALYIYGAGEISTMLVDLKYMKAGEVRNMLTELGVEDMRFPLKTTSNDELVMVAGPPRYVSLVSEMITKADNLREKRTFNEVETRIFPLVYTWADDVSFTANSPESSVQLRGVARMLEEIMSNGTRDGVREASMSNEVATIDVARMAQYRPVIRPDNRLNAVIVRDVASRMPMYEGLIRQLDVPQKLVEVDVTVVELTKKDALDWQLSLTYTLTHGRSNLGTGQNAANIFSPENVAGKGFAGALTHIHSAYALATSITALREKGKARSISRTSLLTVNNLAAEMSDSQSYHAKVVGTEVATLEEVSAGTKLQIKPRILPSIGTNMPNQIWLALELDDGGFESITVDAMPMTRSSTLTTQTSVFEGESIMLAGYLRDIEEDAGWGIPYLRDIPWIGWLFGGKSTSKETVQRMFVLTPHIVDIDRDTLARFQATRLRDVTESEEMQDDAEISDYEREKRDLEREDSSQRRKEKQEDYLSRRKAEIEHGRKMRQFDREREKNRLETDIHNWKDQARAERARLDAEEKEEEERKKKSGKQ